MGCVDGSQEERIATGMSADIRSKWSSKLKFVSCKSIYKGVVKLCSHCLFHRVVASSIIGGGGWLIFIYSCSVQLINFF